jgi:hypothetical protein
MQENRIAKRHGQLREYQGKKGKGKIRFFRKSDWQNLWNTKECSVPRKVKPGTLSKTGCKSACNHNQSCGQFFTIQKEQGNDSRNSTYHQAYRYDSQRLNREMRFHCLMELLISGCSDHEFYTAGDQKSPC